MSEEIRNMQKNDRDHGHPDYSWGASALIWFVILVIFFVFILFVWKPKWVRSKGKHCGKDGELGGKGHHKGGKVDLGRVILAAIIIAFLILVLFWIVWQVANRGDRHHHDKKPRY